MHALGLVRLTDTHVLSRSLGPQALLVHPRRRWVSVPCSCCLWAASHSLAALHATSNPITRLHAQPRPPKPPRPRPPPSTPPPKCVGVHCARHLVQRPVNGSVAQRTPLLCCRPQPPRPRPPRPNPPLPPPPRGLRAAWWILPADTSAFPSAATLRAPTGSAGTGSAPLALGSAGWRWLVGSYTGQVRQVVGHMHAALPSSEPPAPCALPLPATAHAVHGARGGQAANPRRPCTGPHPAVLGHCWAGRLPAVCGWCAAGDRWDGVAALWRARAAGCLRATLPAHALIVTLQLPTA